MTSDPVDPQGRPWRWGKPLSFADAEALGRKFVEGHELTPMEREERLARWIEAEFEAGGYNLLNDVRSYMVEKGITEMTSEVDDVLLAHSICEEDCAREFGHLTGPDLDAAFWDCMRRCSPLKQQSYELDDLPKSEIEDHKLSGTTLFLPGKDF